ncbi:lipase maturation factor family protein [Bdellovibrio sp. HCB337]|uniref:lipase maturation factor family protein n=1 Tax=Bdellovibrio sp. HCB337 TaxID=3394358 RepID=UPI0039A63961
MTVDTGYALAAWILSKGIALSFILAFLTLQPQVLGLYGKNGILSIRQFMMVLREQTGPQRYYELPTIFWFNATDFFINAVTLTGLLSSTLALMGFCYPLMIFIAWVCYLSFVNSGQDFLGFQWDSLLLEVGVLAIFLYPWHLEWTPWQTYEPNFFIRWLFWLLLFKLMFLSGAVKILSKDASWRDMTALKFHYWTQPIPNPVAYFADKAPLWFQKFCCAMMFATEIGIPFLVFGPGKIRWVGATIIIFFQFLIIITGNYAFFNFLTIVLCLFLFDDSFWAVILDKVLPGITIIAETSMFYQSLGLILAILMVPLNLFWFVLAFFENSRILNPAIPIIRAIYNYRFNSSYGLFAVMTKDRPELVLQGSHDHENWVDYEFKYKPSSVTKMPPVVAPYHPRLDWQMWFAALGTFNQNLWLQNLMARIFMNSDDVLRLLKKNPFPEVPSYLRIVKYRYKFSTTKELLQKGQWWEREYVGLYSPVFEKTDFISEEPSFE